MKLSALLLFTLILLPTLAVAEGSDRAQAPAFELTTTDNTVYNNENLRGKTVVLEWFNAGCPFVKRVYESGHLPAVQKEAVEKGVVWITVNSTNAEHGDFVSAEQVPALIQEWKMSSTAYALDAEGKVGRAFEAKTTPTIVVLDSEGRIAYSGAVDNYPQISGDETKLERYAHDAILNLLTGKPIQKSHVKSYGCSVKYAS
jgi:peroxiredoxin